MRSKHLIVSTVALATTLLVAGTALAGGEPKNQAPFTAGAVETRSVPDVFERYVAAHPSGRVIARVESEPKNELPFTRLASRFAAAPDTFERYAQAHPYGLGLTASTTSAPSSRSFTGATPRSALQPPQL